MRNAFFALQFKIAEAFINVRVSDMFFLFCRAVRRDHMGWTYAFTVPRGGGLGIRVHLDEDLEECHWVMVVGSVREKLKDGSLNPLRGRVQVGDLLHAVNHVPVEELGWERAIRTIQRQQQLDDDYGDDDSRHDDARSRWMHLQFVEGDDG